jgi:hypothetical protein
LVAVLALILAAIAVVLALVITDDSPNKSAAASTRTVTVPPPSTATITEQAPAPQPVVPSPEQPTAAEPAEVLPAVGTTCSTPGYVGFDTAGTELVCQYMGADGGYIWVNIAPSSGLAELGGPCDPATEATARTLDGMALLCSPGPNGEPGIWMDGP